MHGNESSHAQVQSRTQGLLAMMLKTHWNTAHKIVLWKSVFILHFIYFSVGIKIHNSDASVYLHRLWMLPELQKALRYSLQGQWISRSWLLSYSIWSPRKAHGVCSQELFIPTSLKPFFLFLFFFCCMAERSQGLERSPSFTRREKVGDGFWEPWTATWNMFSDLSQGKVIHT